MINDKLYSTRMKELSISLQNVASNITMTGSVSSIDSDTRPLKNLSTLNIP